MKGETRFTPPTDAAWAPADEPLRRMAQALALLEPAAAQARQADRARLQPAGGPEDPWR